MAVSLWIAVVALGQTPAPVVQPDVLLFRADESGQALDAVRQRTLDPARLFVVSKSRPSVVCYGRLAEEMKEKSDRLVAVTKLFKGGSNAAWSRETQATMRSIFDLSPFRNEVRSHAAKGVPMETQFQMTTRIEFEVDGQRQMILLDRSPLGKSFELPAAELRLSSLAEAVPARLRGPRKTDNSVACLVPDTTPADAKPERMEKGLKLLFARQKEIQEGLRAAAPESFLTPTDVTDADRQEILKQMTENYSGWGYKSPEDARAAFNKATNLRKSFSIGILITPELPTDHKSSIGWGIVVL